MQEIARDGVGDADPALLTARRSLGACLCFREGIVLALAMVLKYRLGTTFAQSRKDYGLYP